MLGEFQTLVNPGVPIPPFISVLTGITDAAVAHRATTRGRAAGVPRVRSWHDAGCRTTRRSMRVPQGSREHHGHEWPRFPVLDTARLARSWLDRDEAPNCKLATLARFFHSTTTRITGRCKTPAPPLTSSMAFRARWVLRRHDDRRAHDVLHPRASSTGTQTASRPMAFPEVPASTCSEMRRDRVLYIGKSIDMRSRVRQYFTASEGRRAAWPRWSRRPKRSIAAAVRHAS